MLERIDKMEEKKLEQAIDAAKVVSFDVFDTLLFRITARPEAIFSLMGQKIGREDFEQFRRQKQQEISEILVKKKEAPHADLDQIYEYIAKTDQTQDWEQIKELELQMELDAVFQNTEIYQWYRYAISQGKRVIATSDMYLNGCQIRKMIEKCGYAEIAEVYSSADLRCTKYEKTIFNAVAEKEGVQGKEILHIGDNLKADVENARQSGWNAVWYDRNFHLDKRNPGIFCGAGFKSRKESSFWNRLGGDIAGELYINLYRWVSGLQKKNECEQICLLARDGYNLWELFQNRGRKDVIYLEMSRRSLLLAGITRLDQESLDLLPPYALGQTLEEILDYLRLEKEKLDYQKAGFQSLQDIIRTKEDQKRVKQLFQINVEEFLATCEKEREAAKAYFSNLGVLGRRNLYFDCGWNGSSQYLLRRFYRAIGYQDESQFAYVGILDTEKSRRQLGGAKYETYLFGPGKHVKTAMRLAKAIVIPELFFGAPHPSIWYYEGGQVVYEQEQRREYKEQIAEGIAEYFKRVYPFVRKYSIAIGKQEIFASLLRLIESPTAEEAMEIGDVENVDGFVRQKTLKKYLAKLDMETIKRNPHIEIYWEKGILKRPDISVAVKAFVVIKEFLVKVMRKVRR